ncbi:MAG: lipoprotein [Planctomycetota bacterium]
MKRILLALFAAVTLTGCDSAASNQPSFTLAWSEYPSWSVFGVADQKKLIDGAKGKLGPIEEKWQVDIVLRQADYDPCLSMFASNVIDAVCMTNMDALNPALGRRSVAILPTSTSVGADACVTVGIDSVAQLRGTPVYGLEKSVSEYCFVRNLELLGEKESDHKFTNMDPAAAATALQTNSAETKAIVVWNPFVMQTLKAKKDAKVLFDSSTIPEEIIDMVVIGRDALDKPGGDRFAHAVIDAFYQLNAMMAAPATGDDTLKAIGAKFSDLSLEEMREVVKQTRFYSTPDAAIRLFEGDKLKETMTNVVAFCVDHGIVDKAPTIDYGMGKSDLTFSGEYIRAVQAKQ